MPDAEFMIGSAATLMQTAMQQSSRNNATARRKPLLERSAMPESIISSDIKSSMPCHIKPCRVRLIWGLRKSSGNTSAATELRNVNVAIKVSDAFRSLPRI